MSAKPSHKEKKLLKSLHAQGEHGWKEFIHYFEPMIMKIVNWTEYNFTPDIQEDVRQNIYMHLRKAIPRFRGDCSLAYYIKRIAKNECINEIRRQSRSRKHITFSTQKNPDNEWEEGNYHDPDSMDAAEILMQVEQKAILHQAVTNMNTTCMESISLFYFEHKTYSEISEQLGISRNTVGSRLSKCLEKLHLELRKLPLFARSE